MKNQAFPHLETSAYYDDYSKIIPKYAANYFLTIMYYLASFITSYIHFFKKEDRSQLLQPGTIFLPEFKISEAGPAL